MKHNKPSQFQFILTAFILSVFSALLLSACYSKDLGTESRQQTPVTDSQGNWSVSLNIMGGISGQMREITVNQSGHAEYIDKKTRLKSEMQVTQHDLQNIAKLVKILPVNTVPDRHYDKCRDCITYELLIAIDGKDSVSTTNDLTLKDSEMKELITLLLKLSSDIKQ